MTTTTVSSGGAYVTSTVPPTYGPGTTLPPTYGPATSLPPTYGPSTTAALSTYGQTDLTPLTPATSIPTVTQSFQLTTPLTLPTEPNTNTPATLPTELPTSQSTLAQDETSPTVAPPEGSQ